VTIRTNNPGAVVIVSPGDVNRESDGVSDPVFSRRFRPGTSVILEVPPTSNGIPFLRWVLNGEVLADGVLRMTFVVDGPVEAEAMYAVPESVDIDGEDVLRFERSTPAESAASFLAVVRSIDGSVKTIRSGVQWSVSDETVATIDADLGVLVPRPMSGETEVTIYVDVSIAGFDLPRASRVVRLEGTVVEESIGDGPVGQGVPSPCGSLGMMMMLAMTVGLVGLRWSAVGDGRRLTCRGRR
jgi:hypothetical protein